MVIIMMENGKMKNELAKEYKSTKMAVLMMENGKMITELAKE